MAAPNLDLSDLPHQPVPGNIESLDLSDLPHQPVGTDAARFGTIGPPSGMTPRTLLPLTSRVFQPGYRPLTFTDPLIRAGLDVLNLPFRAIGAVRELAQTGRNPLQAFAAPREPSTREEAIMNLVGESLLAQPLFHAGRLGSLIRETPLAQQVESTIQAARPVTVEQAEQVIRSGELPPGFAKRLGRNLTVEQRQALAQRLGQMDLSDLPHQPPRALTSPEGSSMVGEGVPNVPSPPIRPVSPQAPLRPPAVAVRPPSVSPQELAATHPGLDVAPTPEGSLRLPATNVLGDRPELQGVSVIPISRATAASLEGQTVALTPSQFTSKVFRQVPEQFQGLGGATGVQHWYAFDLPQTSGVRYPKRTVPTPSEELKVLTKQIDYSLVQRAKKVFKTTTNFNEAGYIMPDGSLLDFSGRHYAVGYKEGKPILGQPDYLANKRNIDHRELSDLHLGSGSGTELMWRFMDRAKAIRFSSNNQGTDISVSSIEIPNHAQLQQIIKAIKSAQYATIEIQTGTGQIIKYQSIEAPKPTDISRFYQRVTEGSQVSEQPPPYQAGQGPKPIRPLIRVRQQAIQAVTRDLMEQSNLLLQGSRELKASVLRAGGIKPTVGGQLREELQAIRPFLRSTGQPIDQLATELGFEDGEALRQALLATQGQKRPTLTQLRQEAMRIVDSDQGSRILDAIQTQGFTSQAVKRMVREVTRNTEQIISQGSQAVRGILRRAEQKAITPAQLARLARTQRLELGATVTGLRGGLKEAPLSQPDISQVERRVGKVVPRPGQPTGTPPVIPRSTALIPAEVPRPVRDLTQFQSTPFSGLDPSRAAQVIDGTPLGPTERRVIQPLRHGELAMRKEQQAILQDLRRMSQGMRRGSPESHQVFQVLEGRVDKGEVITPRVRETSAWMSEQFDRLLEAVNAARASVGKRPILRRQNYISHITDPTFWEAMREAFGNVPDEASVTLADKFFENLRARGPGFRFGLPRRGGPFHEDAIAAFEAYLPAALRVVHLSTPAKLAGVYLDRSLAGTPNAYKYFSLLVRQVATGEAGQIAKMIPGPLLRASNWIKGRFGKGTVLGNLSSVLQQVYTLPATIAATGPNVSTTAAFWLSRGDGLTFASNWSTVMQSRVMEMDFDLQGLAGRWDAAMAAMFQAADRQMVAHSFLSGYIQAVAAGKDFRAAIEAGDLIAQRTQASFLKADMAPVFRDAFTSSFLQFQNTINGVFNFMKFDIPQSAHPFRSAAYFAGTFIGLAAIYEALGLPHPDRLSEIIPGLSTIRTGGGPVGIRLLLSLSNLGSSDAQQRAKAVKDLKNASFAIVLGAGGNQFRKSLEGVSAVSAGGKFSKTGRLQFPVKGVAESAKAVAFGPYQTKAGQAYIRRGFKPEPMTEEQKQINRAMKNYERSLMR